MNPKKSSVSTDSRSRFTLPIRRFVVSLTALLQLGLYYKYVGIITRDNSRGSGLYFMYKEVEILTRDHFRAVLIRRNYNKG
jgi:hypothetical protein